LATHVYNVTIKVLSAFEPNMYIVTNTDSNALATRMYHVAYHGLFNAMATRMYNVTCHGLFNAMATHLYTVRKARSRDYDNIII